MALRLLLTLALVALSLGMTPVHVAAQDGIETLEDLSNAFQTLARKIRPGVVQIFTSSVTPRIGAKAVGTDLFTLQNGSGSGVIVDPEGYIVTNNHVIDGARRIRVLVSPDPKELDARGSVLKPRGDAVDAVVVGVDRETDLAVLKIEMDRPLEALQLGDSDELELGEIVLAFGSPLGLATSVSMGVVSGMARQLSPENPMIYLQTDAPINPGNSGGPLLTTHGEVIGINTLILSQSGGSEGIGFAAPSNIVSAVYRQIREHGHVRRGEIGTHAQTISPPLAEALGLPQSWGVVLGDVFPNSPAEKAGLRIGDIIRTLDGKPMENGRQFDVNLYGKAPGTTVVLEITRSMANKTVRVQVQERQDNELDFSSLVTREENLVSEIGILGVEIEGELEKRLPFLRIEGGVIVGAITTGGSLWDARLEPGDIIHAVNRRQIASLADLREQLGAIPSGQPVILQIERDQKLQYVAVEIL